jgi:cyclase
MPATKTRHYTFEDLGNDIHAAIARPDGYAVCNSGVVDLGDAGLVFDTGLTPDSAKDLRSASERILGRPPSIAVNSHKHLDHTLGNSEFPAIPIWGTRRTREIMLETHDQLMAELEREQLEKDVRELESRRAALRSDVARKDLEFILQINRALLASVGRLKVVAPDQTFDTRLSLPGTRRAELISFGSGHTEADAIMVLPQEKVVLAGDLVVVGVQPSLGSGDPEHWLTVLDEIERLSAEHIVPGHGPVTTAEGIDETRQYLTGILEAVAAPVVTTLPAALRPWEGSVSLEENLKVARHWVAAHHPRR